MTFTQTHYNAQAPLSEKVICLGWRVCERGTIRGFAKVKVVPWSLIIDGVAVHQKEDRQWAQLPARPQIDKEGNVLREENGKVRYAKILEIEDRRVAWDFNDAVVAAVARKAVAQ
jgi:hypothetical protein